jgi:N-methylhydantoinase B
MKFGQTEIITSVLEAAAWEMCASLIRTAYSPNVKERLDCSAAICDTRGRGLAIATHGSGHLGSTLRLIPSLLERFPLDEMRVGDIFFANDPYLVGVAHLNDCTLVSPVFVDGAVVAFAAAVAHHSDVGGRVPGSEAGDSTSLFQEGIRVPPVMLFSEGKLRKDVLEMFLLNSRTPHFSEGDIYAQTAATASGIRRIQEMYARYGSAVVAHCITEMLDGTERRIRNAIREKLKDGVYRSEDWLDEDGINDDPVKLMAKITVEGDQILFDFTGCAPQLGTGKNIPYTQTMATVYYCLKATVDPNLPINEGLYRTVKVIAPEGSVVNPRAPGGVSSRNLTSMILADVIMDALGQAAPDRLMAISGPYQGIILAGPDPERGRYFVDYENFAGGQGARCNGDGQDVTQVHMSNTSNLPIEIMEIEFPLRVERYEILPDTGGAGRFRGGNGVCRDVRMLSDGTVLTARSARQKFPAQGRQGGDEGTKGAFILNPQNAGGKKLRSTFSEMLLQKGDLLRILSPGGGGLGKPLERDPAAVALDVKAGKVTPDAARNRYGVIVAKDGQTVDAEGTARQRKSAS